MSETVIKIENLKKKYRLGAIGGGTLTADLQSWWARVRGKEDPNTMIGTEVYGKNETFMALNGINLEVKKGETLGIIGGNGAGKSTTLKLLSRVTAPTEGSIKIKGRISSLLEVGTGFHPELTGRENIYLNGAILGMTKEEVDSKIEDIIEFSECRKFIDTPVKRYSSGMFVKLAFSVAAHLDSEILIMDEVLAVGDMKFQQKCIQKMRNIAETENRTILYVSHNMSTIRQLCNRVVVLDKGKIIYNGEVEKGISIYLDNYNHRIQSTYNDFSNLERMNYLKNERAMFKSLEILNKENCLFRENEDMECIVRWENFDNLTGAHLRFNVKLMDDTTIATSISDEKFNCKKGTISEYRTTLNLSEIVPGEYKLQIVLAEVGALGEYIDIDVAIPACYFEIKKSKQQNYDLEWKTNHWGYIRFPNLEKINKEIYINSR